jgi:hypothetical protein
MGTARGFLINAPFAAYRLAVGFQKRNEILPNGDEIRTDSIERSEARTRKNKPTIEPLSTQPFLHWNLNMRIFQFRLWT